jgi:GMP synthase PP-ATPase subunit
MKFIEESVVRIRLYHTFFDKLSKLSDNFHKKSKFITDAYVKIVNENKAKIESEILVQDKFLEFNNSIDSLVHSINKKCNKT